MRHRKEYYWLSPEEKKEKNKNDISKHLEKYLENQEKHVVEEKKYKTFHWNEKKGRN